LETARTSMATGTFIVPHTVPLACRR
jgi:hypothetical protein